MVKRSALLQFNVMAAIGLGVLLPVLETVRRGFGHWFVNFTTMFEDYVAGVGLLACAAGAARGAKWAPLGLLVAWTGITFMMIISTVSQVERHFFGGDAEPRSGVVLVAKILLLLVCVVAFRQSVQGMKEPTRSGPTDIGPV